MNKITALVIGGAYRVANTLGCGFLEKVYENALAHELRKHGLHVEQQRPIAVYYDGVEVGYYLTDLYVQSCVPVELKTARTLDDAHLAQALNFLKAAKLALALLINFGSPRVEVKRVINSLS